MTEASKHSDKAVCEQDYRLKNFQVISAGQRAAIVVKMQPDACKT